MRSCWPLAVALAACYGPSVQPGAPCGPNGECPSGLECRDNICVTPGGALDDATLDDAAADTAMLLPDAMADAMADAMPGYVPWGTPVQLTSLEPPTSGESDPSITANRLTAVLTSGSPADIWECTRTALTDTFTCAAITAINSAMGEKSPEISADGATLYFASERSGDYEIYTATKGGGGWGTPALVTQLNTSSSDEDLAISPDGLTAVVLQDTSPNHFRVATRLLTALPFGTPVVHAELEITTDIAAPSITNGGATIYFHAGATRDLYVAYRQMNGTYTTPSPVVELNTAARDAAPFVSADDKYMIFERAGDIFETTRP
jgi:hypothetical protein